jgi:anti-sigma factor RsiW
MRKDDEKISAWIDGALDKAETGKMEALATGETRIAERASRLRQIDTLVKAAVPLEPLPQELLERLGLPTGSSSDVIDFSAAKARREASRAQAGIRSSAFFANFRNIAALVAVAVLGISTLGWMNQPSSGDTEATYRALGNAPVAGSAANVLVVFDTSVDAREAKAIAAALGAAIEGGQTSGGGWKLAFSPTARDKAIESLRRRKDVRLAEPLEGNM